MSKNIFYNYALKIENSGNNYEFITQSGELCTGVYIHPKNDKKPYFHIDENNEEISIEKIAFWRKKEYSFREKIINASLAIQSGEPLKDYIDDKEIEKSINILADFFTISEN